MSPTYLAPTFEEYGQYLRVCLRGEYTFDSTIHALKEALERAAKQGVQKVLLDMRDLEGSISDNDRRRVADLLQEKAGPEFHLAVVRTERTGPPTNILEEAASHLGRKAKAFFSEEEAKSWLQVDTAASSRGSSG